MSDEPSSITQEDLKNMSPEEIRELQKKNCIFCNIISGKIQSKKIYEDEQVIAILDINPANPGHLLLMPKEHYTIMPQMPDYEAGYISMVTKALSQICLKSLKAEGTNIFIANGVAAGQRSPHFMVHIIPRKSNDGISSFGLIRKKVEKDELKKVQKRFLEKLNGTSGIEEDLDDFEESKKDKSNGNNAPIINNSSSNNPVSNNPNLNSSHLNQPSPKKEIALKEIQKKDDGKKDDINLDDIAKILLGK